jgi:hypothetical protein
MSRHEFAGTDPKHRVVIGWDPPLQTYFGQVHNDAADDEEDAIVHWVGAGIPNLPTVDDLALAMVPWCTITPEMRAALDEDRVNNKA